MDYKNNYIQLIKWRKENPPKEDYEIHHIKPRSMGGSNDETNLVKLKPREHYLAHYLLWKITTGTDHIKMLKAIILMSNKGNISAYTYEKIRLEFIKKIRIKVICLQTLQVFKSLREAASWLKESNDGSQKTLEKNLSAQIRGLRKSICGYSFDYYVEGKEYEKQEMINNTEFKPKKVICLQTLKVYDNARIAEKETGVSYKGISRSCIYEISSKGYDFRFYEDNKEYKQEPMKLIHTQVNRKIQCIETGEIFDSLVKLSTALDTDRSNITRYIKAGKPYKGFHYIFLES